MLEHTIFHKSIIAVKLTENCSVSEHKATYPFHGKMLLDSGQLKFCVHAQVTLCVFID